MVVKQKKKVIKIYVLYLTIMGKSFQTMNEQKNVKTPTENFIHSTTHTEFHLILQ